MRKIGILGGTFDPPHIGHLIIAEEVKQALQLEEIWFIPTYEPPHKKEAALNGEQRVNMLKEAIAGNSSFHVNTMEVERSGKSYTVDTMRTLIRQFKDTQFFFIIGGDMVEYLPNWYKIEELLEMVTFVGVNRPGYSLHSTFPIQEVSIPTIDISSSLVRKRLINNESIRYLVPETVYNFIKENHLYE